MFPGWSLQTNNKITVKYFCPVTDSLRKGSWLFANMIHVYTKRNLCHHVTINDLYVAGQCPRHHNGRGAGVLLPPQHNREAALWPGRCDAVYKAHPVLFYGSWITLCRLKSFCFFVCFEKSFMHLKKNKMDWQSDGLTPSSSKYNSVITDL